MEARKIVFHETGIVAVGVLICTVLMIGVFALLGNLDLSVVLGGLVGLVLAVGNFFFMAICASLAADKATEQDVKGGKALVQSSYFIRLLVLFGTLFPGAGQPDPGDHGTRDPQRRFRGGS